MGVTFGCLACSKVGYASDLLGKRIISLSKSKTHQSFGVIYPETSSSVMVFFFQNRCCLSGFGQSSTPSFTSSAKAAEQQFVESIESWRKELDLMIL